MAYAVRPSDFQRNIRPYSRAVEAAPQAGLLRRLFNAVFENCQHRTEREVEAYLSRTGHRFTDSIEREINEHMLHGGWNARR